MWHGLVIVSRGWLDNAGALVWPCRSDCEPHWTGGRKCPSQDLERSIFQSVISWPWLQNLWGFLSQSYQIKISGNKKKHVGCSATSPGHSHAYSILETRWSGVSNMGCGATVTSKVLPCKSQSLLFVMEWWLEGRTWLFDTLGKPWLLCWAC